MTAFHLECCCTAGPSVEAMINLPHITDIVLFGTLLITSVFSTLQSVASLTSCDDLATSRCPLQCLEGHQSIGKMLPGSEARSHIPEQGLLSVPVMADAL